MSLQPTYQVLSSYDHLIGPAKGQSRIEYPRNMTEMGNLVRRLAIDNGPAMVGIANHLKDPSSRMQTLYNVWHFAKTNLHYAKDDPDGDGGRKEQPRTPQRSWADRFRGVDCEDYSAFIASILYAMPLPAELDIVEQAGKDTGFGHIYPVSGETSLDILTPFGIPAPHITKRMKVEVLSGVTGGVTDDPNFAQKKLWLELADPHTREALIQVMPYVQRFTNMGVPVYKPGAPIKHIEELFAQHISNPIGDLGAINLFKKKKKDAQPNNSDRGIGSVGLMVVPAMILGRTAFLELVKANGLHLAQKFRLMYLTEDQATQGKLNMPEWRKLFDRRERVERTWHNLGGNIKEFRKAVSKGAHFEIRDLAALDPATLTAAAAAAVPIIAGLAAALSGVDFKAITKGTDQEAAGDAASDLGQAAHGIIENLKKKKKDGNPDAQKELDLLTAAQDAAAPKAGEEGHGKPNTERDPSTDKKPVWPWIAGGVAVLALGTGIVWAATSNSHSPKKVKRVA